MCYKCGQLTYFYHYNSKKMEEKVFLVVSLVRDLTDDTLLVIREKSVESIVRRPMDFFPMELKPIGENNIQTAIRVTREKTGVVIHNPVEVARIKVDLEDTEKNYEAVVFLSTDFAGTLHPAAGTDVIWQKEDEVKAHGQIVGFFLQKILAGKYVKGRYNHVNDKFFDTEVRFI